MNFANLLFALLVSPFAIYLNHFLITRLIRRCKCTETAQGTFQEIVTSGAIGRIRVEFYAGGKKITADTLPVGPVNLEEDSPVTVRYHPDDPEMIYLDEQISFPGAIVVAALTIGFTFLMVVLILGAF